MGRLTGDELAWELYLARYRIWYLDAISLAICTTSVRTYVFTGETSVYPSSDADAWNPNRKDTKI